MSKFNLNIEQLKASERSVYSQGGQDGVLEAIFNQIPNSKTFIEFGARDGLDSSNTANLRLNYEWLGYLFDIHPLSPIVAEEDIRVDNINYLLHFYFPAEYLDFLSIDIDGNDYWIWETITKKPKVVSIEYNSKFKNNESFAIEYNPEHRWEGNDYYGASLLALKKLGERKGYTLVYVVDRFDAIFIRNDLIDKDYIPPTLDELLPQPIIAFDKVSNKKWIEI